MKNRQFIVLCLLIIAGFVFINVKLDKHFDYLRNIDNNVARVDEYQHKKGDRIYGDDYYHELILQYVQDIRGKMIEKDGN